MTAATTRADYRGRWTLTRGPPIPSVADERERTDLRRPERVVPPQSADIAAELAGGNRRLCHCLNCGRQLVAISHGDGCLFCGSAAVVVE